MKAMILAAGEGTRLRPLTLALPKPMIPIANIPLLARTIGLLRAHGVTEIAVNLYHRPDVIRDALGDGSALGVRLVYSDETALLGTAGGVKRMETFLDETFLVLYGDNLYQADFAPLIAFHRARKADVTIATFTAPNPSACGLVVTGDDGRVTRFQEKPPPAEVFTDQANAGVYVVEPHVLKCVPDHIASDWGHDVFPVLLASARNPNKNLRGDKLYATALQGYLQDTGTVASYRQANWDALSGSTGAAALAPNGVLIGDGAEVANDASLTGRVIMGAGCVVGAHAVAEETICWGGCQIGAGATVRNAILGANVVIGAAATVEDGALLADNVIVAPGARVPVGARIGPGERVEAA